MFSCTSSRFAFGANLYKMKDLILVSRQTNLVAAYQSWFTQYNTSDTWVDMVNDGTNGNNLTWHGDEKFAAGDDGNGWKMTYSNLGPSAANCLIASDSEISEKLSPFTWDGNPNTNNSVTPVDKTYVIWVRFRTNNVSGFGCNIMGTSRGGAAQGFLISRSSATAVSCKLRDKDNEGPNAYMSSFVTQPTWDDGNKFTMLAVTISASDVQNGTAGALKFYANNQGLLSSSFAFTSGTFDKMDYPEKDNPVKSKPFFINAALDSTQYAGDFDVAALYVWDDVLTESEISTVWTETKSKFPSVS
jgi:hypothetical protein